MTLDQWLREATGVFPAGAQKRLAQEYRAHLEESVDAGGANNVEKLFGEPKTVRRQLQKSYVETRQLTDMDYTGERLFWIMTGLCCLVSGSVLTLSPTVLQYTCLGLGAGLWLFVWRLPLHWSSQRRTAFRNIATMLFVMPPTLLMSFLSQQPQYFAGAFQIGVVIWATWRLFNLDRRIRHTLELEGAA